MAEAGNGRRRPGQERSERRLRRHLVSVRLSDAELAELRGRLAVMNGDDGQGGQGRTGRLVSSSSRYSLGRLLRDAALLRPLSAAPVADTTTRELAALRADLARAGTLLRTWLRYGPGAYGGKGGRMLMIGRPPEGVDAEAGRRALSEIEAGLAELRRRLACSSRS